MSKYLKTCYFRTQLSSVIRTRILLKDDLHLTIKYLMFASIFVAIENVSRTQALFKDETSLWFFVLPLSHGLIN